MTFATNLFERVYLFNIFFNQSLTLLVNKPMPQKQNPESFNQEN